MPEGVTLGKSNAVCFATFLIQGVYAFVTALLGGVVLVLRRRSDYLRRLGR
ncbi:hypothetical protein RSK20926_17432 [Roseobacter sp. SK209-2-6]|uniref:hypothetical protein n=1 Tax=Roseobacter sp. SK209-2-6 TaxID=388739 RepID=UPI0000F3F26A|nr:hypothetical protein [Roseobacter sp. SK209-2-6]EBA14371.1 hypothetical protein RSK20926_17432 [Roseobacter sp. SK209-2-6]